MDDLIHRSRAVDIVQRSDGAPKEVLLKQINRIPPALKRGEWVVYDSVSKVTVCSVCGFATEAVGAEQWKVCPVCISYRR